MKHMAPRRRVWPNNDSHTPRTTLQPIKWTIAPNTAITATTSATLPNRQGGGGRAQPNPTYQPHAKAERPHNDRSQPINKDGRRSRRGRREGRRDRGERCNPHKGGRRVEPCPSVSFIFSYITCT
jgi:hypothetical protein